MNLDVSLQDLDLGPLVRGFLPSGVVIESVRLAPDAGLVVGLRAPMVGAVALHAAVDVRPQELLFRDFRVEGGGILRGLLVGEVRKRVADLDSRFGPVRAWGESDGERLHVSWSPQTS